MARTPDFNYNRTLSDVLKDNSRKKSQLLPETGWNIVGVSSGEAAISFEGDWQQAVNFTDLVPTASDSEIPVAWYHSVNGEVRLRGMIEPYGEDLDADVGTTIFTLPEEARPETTQTFVCPANLNYGTIDLSSIRFRAWVAGTEDAG